MAALEERQPINLVNSEAIIIHDGKHQASQARVYTSVDEYSLVMVA